jgi:hypothetical protein
MYELMVSPAPSQLKSKFQQSPYITGITHKIEPAIDHLSLFLKD